MRQSEWLLRAGNLHQVCAYEQSITNGSKKITASQATELNALQKAINSKHATKPVSNNEARESLDQMFTWVKGGLKTPPLSKG